MTTYELNQSQEIAFNFSGSNPIVQPLVREYTWTDVLHHANESLLNHLFIFWTFFVGYLLIDHFKLKLFKDNPEMLDNWNEIGFTFIFSLSLFYPIVYILYRQ